MPQRMNQSEETIPDGPIEPVYKSIRVKASASRAFKIFTDDMDGWWPRTHHIGSSPMVRAVLEPRVGGDIYSVQENGENCKWGSVLQWNPPNHFVMAWHVRPDWTHEPDPAKCSEVHVTFTPGDDGTTLVELEHRHLERHGAGADKMREAVERQGGWPGLLDMYGKLVDESAEG
ncbi:MAG TPA: SRPBCC family protein [Terriglobales bacterium]|nr:SRPBCC family protein [Terriglobales bacterium]